MRCVVSVPPGTALQSATDGGSALRDGITEFKYL